MEWQGELVMKKSRKQWVDLFRETIEDIEGEHFSSHDFIGKFCYRFKLEWKQLLAQYDTNANQKVNAYIARLLSLYESDLPIIKYWMEKCKGLRPAIATAGQRLRALY